MSTEIQEVFPPIQLRMNKLRGQNQQQKHQQKRQAKQRIQENTTKKAREC